MFYRDLSDAEFVKAAEMHVAAINKGIDGIPRDRVRLHCCWGNWDGPHIHDVPLELILPVLYQANVGALSIEFANPRHQHEYEALRRHPLPSHMALIPGTIDTTTNIVEHPEVVARRIQEAVAAVGDRERVIASADCGFGTFTGREWVIEPAVWLKLKSLREGADIASARLWGERKPRRLMPAHFTWESGELPDERSSPNHHRQPELSRFPKDPDTRPSPSTPRVAYFRDGCFPSLPSSREADVCRKHRPDTSRRTCSHRSVPSTFFAPASFSFRISVASPCGIFTRGSFFVSINVSDMETLGLDPDSAVDAVPHQIFGRAVEDRGLEAVGRLKFEIEQRRFGRAQTMFFLGRNEYQVAGPYVADAFGTFRPFRSLR